ncbi:MAG: HXXEE domain-containing protein, partial [Nitrososphaerales archaeon]
LNVSKEQGSAPIALIVNLIVGWLAYFLAAVFNLGALWLGIAVMFASFGNFVIHTFVFNIRGKMTYNPGMVTGIILCLPISAYFFYLVISTDAASPLDWILGVLLGVAFAYFGIFKVIDWLKDENTPYVFPARFLMPARRKTVESN